MSVTFAWSAWVRSVFVSAGPVLSLLNDQPDLRADNGKFAELTTEVCDGRPSDVEREGVTFGGGRFCPWTARVISIQED